MALLTGLMYIVGTLAGSVVAKPLVRKQHAG